MENVGNMDGQDRQDKDEPPPAPDESVLEKLIQQGTALIVGKTKIAEGAEYNLSGERYRETETINTVYDLVPVGRFLRPKVKSIDPRNTPDEIFELWSIPAFDAGRPEILPGRDIGSAKKAVYPEDILLSRIIPHIRRAWVVKEDPNNRRQIASTEWLVFSSNEIIPQFLQRVLVCDTFHVRFMQTITGVGGSLSRANPAAVAQIQIPVPPLEVQREIVAEIEGYQRVIDGARAVIDNYRPHISIDPDWPMVTVGSLAEIVRGSSPRPKRDPGYYGGPIPRLMVADITRDGMYATPQLDSLTYEGAKKSRSMKKGDVVVTVSGNPGLPTILATDACIHDGFVGLRNLKCDVVLPTYLYFCLVAQHEIHGTQSVGAVFKNLTTHQIRNFKIPLPLIETQQSIVDEIDAEQSLVNTNHELIERFEKKIQAAIGRVWGDGKHG